MADLDQLMIPPSPVHRAPCPYARGIDLRTLPDRMLPSCGCPRDAATRRPCAHHKALATLVAKMDRIEASDAYRGIWSTAFVHGAVYSGETWEAERDAARRLVHADHPSCFEGCEALAPEVVPATCAHHPCMDCDEDDCRDWDGSECTCPCHGHPAVPEPTARERQLEEALRTLGAFTGEEHERLCWCPTRYAFGEYTPCEEGAGANPECAKARALLTPAARGTRTD